MIKFYKLGDSLKIIEESLGELCIEAEKIIIEDYRITVVLQAAKSLYEQLLLIGQDVDMHNSNSEEVYLNL